MWMTPILRSAEFFHAVSPQVALRVQELGVPVDKLMTVPLGIDVKSIRFREPTFEDSVRLVCTRNLRYPVYDVPTILRSMAILNSSGFNATLTVCGSGKLQPELEVLASKLQITDRVHFMGGYAYDQLESILHTHDIYVSASLSDGASLSLFEAMAAGLFPIVSDIEANRVWLDDEESFFSTGNPDSLANRIREACRRQDFCRKAVRKNRQVVEARCDRGANLRAILQFGARHVAIGPS
jgi:glycosyltransferase involved in cell wall biosynthesis